MINLSTCHAGPPAIASVAITPTPHWFETGLLAREANLTGVGLLPDQVREGARRVATLHREMIRARGERLRALGFSAEEVSRQSAYHAKNFM